MREGLVMGGCCCPGGGSRTTGAALELAEAGGGQVPSRPPPYRMGHVVGMWDEAAG
jgi:hypothetical protein